MRVWSYVITTDRGSAPNYDAPAVTLTICKPRIRMRAQPGNLILAFNGHTLARNPNSVRWAGIVSEVIPLEHYWDDPRFRGKRPDRSVTPDNIYRLIDGHWQQVANNSHHEDDIKTDTGGKHALVFAQTWHMGDSAPELPEIFGLRVKSNRRRLEPQKMISAQDEIELRAWLTAHNRGISQKRQGSPCRPQTTLPKGHAKCWPPS